MKKLLFFIAMTTFAFTANAQFSEKTEQGKILIEANTNFGGGHVANTGFRLNSTSISGNSSTSWGLGLEGGYFVIDDLAVKLGLGYSDSGSNGLFSYKIGAKYYIIKQIPVQLDLSGNTPKGSSPMWLGLQAGYAISLSDTVNLEPGLRYNYGLGDAEDINVLQLNVGFTIHL